MRPTRLLGIAALAASAAILIASARGVAMDIAIDALPPSTLATLALLVLAYAGSLALLAIGWRSSFAGDAPLLPIAALSVYGASVLPKYLPGTIFQYLSRQTLGRRLGWQQRAMAEASFAEIALHVIVSALLLSLLATGGMLPAPEGWHRLGLAMLVAAILAAWLLLNARGAAARLRWAAPLQLGFFLATLATSFVCAQLAGIDAPGHAAAAFLLAWLLGFVVPGVPGGIGVRESALALLLAGSAGPAEALLFAGLMRLVTLGGDLLFAGLALLLRRRLPSAGAA